MLNRDRWRAAAWILLALAGGAASGCGAGDDDLPAPRRILFITVDTLRADHLGVYGYPRNTSPNVDQLAGDGVVFGLAIAQWPKTAPSFASMFTGRYPQSTGMTHRAARRLPEEYVTLAEMLRDAGYKNLAVVSNPVLSAALGWSQGFDSFVETWKTAESQSDDPSEYRQWINAVRVNELAQPLLERHANQDRLFIWLHYSDPHVPYVLPEGLSNPFLDDRFDVQDEPVEDDLSDSRGLGDETRLGFYIAQYDANIFVADRFIGEILDLADGLGLLTDALVVFTSDHGEGMGEHKYYFRHGGVPYNTNSHVPLLVSYPGVIDGARRVSAPVELIDLYPTLAEIVAGQSVGEELEGRSLVAQLLGWDDSASGDPKSIRFAFSESGQPRNLRSHYRTIQDVRWKLVFHPAVTTKDRELPALFELYDLVNDPLEQDNLAGSERDQFERLWPELSAWMQQGDTASAVMGEEEGHSEETLKALRALGYLD